MNLKRSIISMKNIKPKDFFEQHIENQFDIFLEKVAQAWKMDLVKLIHNSNKDLLLRKQLEEMFWIEVEKQYQDGLDWAKEDIEKGKHQNEYWLPNTINYKK